MIEHQLAQYTPEWWNVRRGRPTASDMNRILKPGSGERSGQWEDYLGELVIATSRLFVPGVMTEQPMNPAMKHGIDTEPEARAFYTFTTGRQVRQTGFCTTDCGRFGMSPDGLTNCRGVIELKCPQPETHEGYLKKMTVPTCYWAQVCGQLVVGEGAIDYVDFLSYCRGYEPLLVRVEWNPFCDTLKAALEAFWKELTETLSIVYSRPVRSWADVETLIRMSA